MTTPVRTQRADATRNRELLLAAAEQEFAEKGLEARWPTSPGAQGGQGTIFRHFATKEDLIAAIVGGHFANLTAVARELLEADEPGAALLELLTVTADNLQQKDLTFLQSVTAQDSQVIALRDELYEAISALVERARTAGAVRPDLTGTDVFVLMCTPVHAVGFLSDPAPDVWRRYLA